MEKGKRTRETITLGSGKLYITNLLENYQKMKLLSKIQI